MQHKQLNIISRDVSSRTAATKYRHMIDECDSQVSAVPTVWLHKMVKPPLPKTPFTPNPLHPKPPPPQATSTNSPILQSHVSILKYFKYGVHECISILIKWPILVNFIKPRYKHSARIKVPCIIHDVATGELPRWSSAARKFHWTPTQCLTCHGENSIDVYSMWPCFTNLGFSAENSVTAICLTSCRVCGGDVQWSGLTAKKTPCRKRRVRDTNSSHLYQHVFHWTRVPCLVYSLYDLYYTGAP